MAHIEKNRRRERIEEDTMGTYRFDEFPFDDPDIARALSHALAVLLWNTPPPPSASPKASRRGRQKQRAARTQQTSTTDAVEDTEKDSGESTW